MRWMNGESRSQGVAQLFRRGAHLWFGHRGQLQRVRFALRHGVQNPLTAYPQGVADHAGELDPISSSNASSRFCSRTLSRVTFCFARDTVRQSRCSGSGT